MGLGLSSQPTAWITPRLKNYPSSNQAPSTPISEVMYQEINRPLVITDASAGKLYSIHSIPFILKSGKEPIHYIHVHVGQYILAGDIT